MPLNFLVSAALLATSLQVRAAVVTTVPGSILPGSVLPGSVLPGSVLPGSVLPGSVFPGSVLPGSVLPGSVLPGSVFPDSVFPDSVFPDSVFPDSVPPDSVPPDSLFPEGVSLRIDRAIAVVDGRVVTNSEVDIALALSAHDRSPEEVIGPRGRQPGEWWIEQVVLRELAGDVSVYQPQAIEVRERVTRLTADMDAAELANLELSLGIDRDAITTWVYSRLVVERFVHRSVTMATPAGETISATRQRYAAWVEELRVGVSLRRIAPVQRR